MTYEILTMRGLLELQTLDSILLHAKIRREFWE